MRVLVTGCAGFIGSNLVDALLQKDLEVVGIDNLSTGTEKFLENALKNKKFKFYKADLLESNKLIQLTKGCHSVYHLSANADVRFGLEHPKKDLENNTIATFNLLEAMRSNDCRKIFFSSTGSVYGEAAVIPTPEDAPFPVQTSLYGASKLACEGLISSYHEGFDFECHIFRFVSILGKRYTHGHVYDFYKQLKEHPNELNVLGNGLQKKSYLHIEDCINAILKIKDSNQKFSITNLGHDEYCEVKDSVKWICDELNVQPKLNFEDKERGWIGDNPFIHLDNKKLRSLGWEPKYSIEESVRQTVRFLESNEWVFEERK